MLGLGLSLQKGISAFNAGRALVSSYIRRVTEAGGVLQNTACDAAAINELNQDRLLEPASWVLVPDGIEEDIVFAQKPTSGLGDLNFQRASDATYTDSTGVVRRSPYNLFTWSEDFSNAAWSKSASSISSNVTTAPNGTLTADKLIEDTANTSHTIFQTISISASTNYNYSVYLKAAERFRFRIRFTGFSGAQDATVNLNTQTTSLGTLTSVGNGWFRFAWSVNSGAGGSSTLVAITLQDDSGNSTYLGNGTSGAFIWGAQLVEGSVPLDYFPTTNRQDVPRIDFRNADGTLSSCGRLLLEPQRTNVALQSESLNTAPNVVDASTFTANVYTSPSGTQSADQLTETTANDRHGFYQYTLLTTQAYTASVFTKQTGRRYISFTSDVTGTQVSSFFDLQTKSVLTSASGHTCSVQDYGDGWLRLIVSFTASAGNRFLIWGGSINGTNNTYVGSTSVSQTFWGYQLEAGAYQTTYIPTTTAAVTRIADAASKTGVSSLIGQTAGTIFADLSYIATSTASARWFNVFGTSQNIALASNGINQIRVITNSITDTLSTAPTSNTGIKIAFAYNNSGVVCFINGTQYTLTNGGGQVMNSLTSIAFDLSLATGVVEAKINQAALFPTRLTNDQLEVLTSEGYGTYALLAQSLNCVLQ